VPAGFAHAGPLQADDLLLIYNDQVPASKELAEYYATARRVPPARLCPVSIPGNAEEISGKHFDRLIRAPVRSYLQEKGLEEQVKCLVTFYGLPIRVSARPLDSAWAETYAAWKREFAKGLDELERSTNELQRILEGKAPKLGARMPQMDDYVRIVKEYLALRERAWAVIQRQSESREEAQQRRAVLNLVEKVEGPGGILARIRPTTPETKAQYEESAREVREVQQKAAEILQKPLDSPDRDEGRRLIRQSNGLISFLQVMDHDLVQLRPDKRIKVVHAEVGFG
jgi:uncharacterized protein (TIGR03790 family)